ncbi:MlaD family protein [Nocardia vaccinii]|uniref:MlaD family protein n=1 Tax=Nocardia vaccinii TaxID=1822 RepID=UPI00082D50CD|nr:MlaD family protein [Nocardia vaccinii]
MTTAHGRRGIAELARRAATALFSLVVLAVMSGCGFNPEDYSVPGSGVGGPTYTLRIDFASVLNLPAGAKVLANGTQVGQLTDLQLHRDYAVATVQLTTSLHLPAGTGAELRQTTLLGDTYIALVPPTGGTGPALIDGDTIPITRTTAGPQAEDVLQRMALLVNGGSLTALQNAVDRLNQALPADPAQSRDLAAGVTAAIHAAATDTTDIGRIIDANRTLTQTLVDDRNKLALVFSPTGNNRLHTAFYFTDGVLYIIIQLQNLTNALTWLIPELPHLNDFLGTGVPLLRASSASAVQFNGTIGAMLDLGKNKLLPFLADGPSIDIARLHIGGNDVTTDALTLLRVIGALP